MSYTLTAGRNKRFGKWTKVIAPKSLDCEHYDISYVGGICNTPMLVEFRIMSDRSIIATLVMNRGDSFCPVLAPLIKGDDGIQARAKCIRDSYTDPTLVTIDLAVREYTNFSNYNEYIEKIKQASVKNDVEFCELLNTGMKLMSLSDDYCARIFDVSRPSVTRWRNASTKPHAVIRKLVFRELTKEAKKRIRQQDSLSS